VRRAVIVLLLLAGIARADDRAAAEKYFHLGEKAYAAQNFAAAAANFEEAFKALPLPEIAFSAAQAYRQQYRVEPKLEYAKRAAELYHVYLDKVKTGGKVGVAADSVGEMEREVDKLTAAGQKAAAVAAIDRTRLGVSPIFGVEKQGALREIADLPDTTAVKVAATIDGKPVAAFALIDVEPGPHKVHVEAEGYLPADAVATVVKGETRVAEPPLAPRPGTIELHTERGARIRVDGRPVGTAPLDPPRFELPAGKHLLRLVNPEAKIDQSVEVEIEPNETTVKKLKL